MVENAPAAWAGEQILLTLNFLPVVRRPVGVNMQRGQV